MIKTYNMLVDEYKEYGNPYKKIERVVKEGSLIKLTKGLYETNREVPGYLLANAIYNPSYLSFDFALSFYGLIPEAVYSFTSATFRKKKEKEYSNFFGNFYYRDIPDKAYPFDIVIYEEMGYQYSIATAEKAICDKLYSLRPVKNKKELLHLLFEDLRIDRDEFNKLDYSKIESLCDLYPSTNLNLLKKVVR